MHVLTLSNTSKPALPFFKTHATFGQHSQTGFVYTLAHHFPILSLEPVGSRAPSFPSEFISNELRKMGGLSFALLCQAQAFPVPMIRYIHFKVTRNMKGNSTSQQHYHGIICCNTIENHAVTHAEPVGAKAPTFSTELKSSSFQKRLHSSFGLLCQAQAYPVPLIRSGRIPRKRHTLCPNKLADRQFMITSLLFI